MKQQLGINNKRKFKQFKNRFGYSNNQIKETNDTIRKLYQNQIENRSDSVFDLNEYNNNQVLSDIKNQLKTHKGKSVNIMLKSGVDVDESIPSNNFDGWWKKFSMNTLNELIYNINDDEFDDMMFINEIESVSTSNAPRQEQSFADGVQHCLLGPIGKWIHGLKDKSNSYSKKNMLIKYNEFNNDYKDGVPENDLKLICDTLRVDIDIEAPLSTTPFISVTSDKKRLKKFKYINTRFNHVELGGVINRDIKEVDDLDELKDLQTKLDADNTFYTFKRFNEITSISTIENTYTIKSNRVFNDISKSFEEYTGLNNCYICDIQQPELSMFIRNGLLYNGTIDFKDTDDFYESFEDDDEIDVRVNSSVKHIDQKKAYTQFRECKYYKGFVGKITDFRPTNSIQGIGYYSIKNLTGATEFLSKIGYKFNSDEETIYGSPELEFLKDQGCSFEIVAGAWGGKFEYDFEYQTSELQDGTKVNLKSKSIDNVNKFISSMRLENKKFKESGINKKYHWKLKKGVRLNNDMYKKIKGVSCYSKWSGCKVKTQSTDSVYMKCSDLEYASAISGEYDNVKIIKGRKYDFDRNTYVTDDSLKLSYKRQDSKHLAHIVGFITMYQRLNMIEQLMLMDIDKIIRVCVDGIYYLEHEFELKRSFNHKQKMTLSNEASETYFDSMTNDIKPISTPKEYYQYELHDGVGGGGKTHNNVIDKGLIKLLYVAPPHKLCSNKRSEYDVNTEVLSNLISNEIDPHKWKSVLKNYNTIVFDEVSQFSVEDLDKIYDRFSDCKLIFAGDIGYQLPCVKGTPVSIKSFYDAKRFEYNINHRVKCPRLQKILDLNRKLIKDNKSAAYINKVMLDNLKECVVSEQYLKDNYNHKQDIILTSTHKIREHYDKLFIHIEKFRVTNKANGFYNGDIVFEKHKGVSSDHQHGFTVHSIQGETAHGNLFININRLFSPQMFYTALSRAKYLSQVKLISLKK